MRRKRRVLLVNCYLDDTRASIGRRSKIPPGMGPVYLAGALSPERCEIRIYSELHSGPLEDEALLAWPDMLVLTGLTTALDRMRHLTAYARTRNPRVVVVAGGHAVRALPSYCRRFFDYCCLGDVEELGDVVDDAFGPGHAADEMAPRFDLAPWLGGVGYLEASRHCNFRCAFCVMTAEDRPYRIAGLDELRRDITALGRREHLLFIDNNFFGNDRRRFHERLDLLRELRREGWFKGWGALVTGDFFLDPQNLVRAREAGCIGLFTGLESFDVDWLERSRKAQNTRLDPIELTRRTLGAGIVLSYGMVFDLTTRTVADARRELDAIVDEPALALPAYLSVSIPMLKTPFFRDCVAGGRLLPHTRVRDLDSTTLCVRPLDPLSEAVRFVRDLQGFRGYRMRTVRHAFGFARRYRRDLDGLGMAFALAHAALLCTPVWAARPTRWRGVRRQRTHVSTTDVLDAVYRPAFPVEPKLAGHFEPTYLTDAGGELHPEVAGDLVEEPRAVAANARPDVADERRSP